MYYDKLKSDIENQLKSYYTQDFYDVKRLNDTDEAENILIMRNTVFLGNNRMQIKKMDGTIEKYNIEKYYPIDQKDEMIKELNKKVEELERRLNDEPTKHNESTKKCNKSSTNDDEYVESESNSDNE